MVDPECAICNYLHSSLEPAKKLANCISLTSGSRKEKIDFGLYLSVVKNLISQIERLQHYHREYHLNGEKNPVKSKAGEMPINIPGWDFDEISPAPVSKPKFKSKKRFKNNER